MIKDFSKLTKTEKKILRNKLLENHRQKKCHYCGIPEKEFQKIMDPDRKFYGKGMRGQSLEIDHKNPSQKTVDMNEPELNNLAFACAVCNMAKSNMFYYDEFLEIGKVISEIWKKRAKEKIPPPYREKTDKGHKRETPSKIVRRAREIG